jgi:cation transport ATPase
LYEVVLLAPRIPGFMLGSSTVFVRISPSTWGPRRAPPRPRASRRGRRAARPQGGPVAERIAAETGLDRVYAEQAPEDKLDVVREMRADPALAPVVMVGDGVNDAPALALADVGIAISGPGATVSAETADAVITVDRIDRVATAVEVGRRSLGIARQSVVFGIGLSLVAMGFAAVGYIPPLAGALLQEGIDVAVILNALRALRD